MLESQQLLSGQKWHNNPRQISEKQFSQLKAWLEELGDLSGVVHDLTTNQYVGGNQRSTVFGQAEVVLTETFEPPTRTGTVALGYILHEGERYQYRQVRWDEQKCRKANIVANSGGGTWDMDVLANEWSDLPLAEWNVPIPKHWGQDVDGINEQDEWQGMPDFEPKGDDIRLMVSFRNEEDRQKFCDLHDIDSLKSTGKTWSAWWPKKEREDVSSLKYE